MCHWEEEYRWDISYETKCTWYKGLVVGAIEWGQTMNSALREDKASVEEIPSPHNGVLGLLFPFRLSLSLSLSLHILLLQLSTHSRRNPREHWLLSKVFEENSLSFLFTFFFTPFQSQITLFFSPPFHSSR